MSRLRETAQAVVDAAWPMRDGFPGYSIGFEAFDALCNALAEPEWIPVSERVPEWDSRRYWVAYKSESKWVVAARKRSKLLPWTVWWATVRCDILYWKRIYHEPPPDPPTE